MAYVSLPAQRGASSKTFFERVAAFFAALQAADQRVGYGAPFGL